ncbi:MAG: hypothetical protein J7K85_05225 [Anaerolineaceae bacterium]|nr:hypothetical protein [Anaerolineaceae bacterium]
MKNSLGKNKQERKVMLTMFLSVGAFTFSLVLLAVLSGVAINQYTGKQTILNWVPLFVALPINMYMASVFSRKAARKLFQIRNTPSPEGDQNTIEQNSEHE